ncbi:MAG: tetratricopeptide repeat protein [Thainema sp.]
MQKEVAEALEQKDYRTVAQLLKQWQQENSQDPWFRLYVGRFQEATGKLQAAEVTYRKLLKAATVPKVVTQARQGLQRLDEIEAQRRQQAMQEATAEPSDQELGLLVIEPVVGEQRREVAQGFAKVMQIEPYLAQMQLPSRGWRLHRIGSIGALNFYVDELRQVNVPAFCQRISTLQQVHVFRVDRFQSLDPQATAICHSEDDQLGALAFDWSEVSQRVEGRLPILESVVDLGPWNKLQRKERTQDYMQICDLHLPRRNSILRICDRTYQFQRSAEFAPMPNEPPNLTQLTNRISWNRLIYGLNQRITGPIQSDFTIFGESALDLIDLLGANFKSHIDISRQTKSNWDDAFHLYSSLLFIQR